MSLIKKQNTIKHIQYLQGCSHKWSLVFIGYLLLIVFNIAAHVITVNTSMYTQFLIKKILLLKKVILTFWFFKPREMSKMFSRVYWYWLKAIVCNMKCQKLISGNGIGFHTLLKLQSINQSYDTCFFELIIIKSKKWCMENTLDIGYRLHATNLSHSIVSCIMTD